MASYTFDSGKLIIKTSDLKEFAEIIVKVGYQNITYLNCSDNSLTSLPSELGNLTNLTHFYCSNNQLISLPSELGNLINLTDFYCCSNRLTSLVSELGNLKHLTTLNCSINRLTSLNSELGNLTNLTYLDCSYNRLKSLPSELGNLTQLVIFRFGDNLFEYVPPNVLRLIERKRIFHNIYNDSQSVHDSSIQKGVKESLQKLLSKKPVLTKERMWEYLFSRLSPESISLLLEYSESSDIHSILGITFSEALIVVVSTIYQNPNQDEILKILNTEILDSECKCFTGRISRLVNSLNGYDDRVNIQISENDQLGTIISLLGEFEPYDPEIHKNKAREELLSRGYPKETIEEWINHII